MPTINDNVVDPHYDIEFDKEARKKWIKIQLKMLRDYEEGTLEQDTHTRYALNYAAFLCTGTYIAPELTDEIVKYLSNICGNHVTAEGRFFDGDQLKAIDLLQGYSELYNKKFGSSKK